MTGAAALALALRLGAMGAAVSAGAPSGPAPLRHFHDLVAGSGVAGFENGEFYRAAFDGPLGLAVLPKREALVVSDRANDRLRVIWLGRNNRVETLAGSGVKGRADGPLAKASFDGPTALVAVSDHSLVVYDSGTRLLRLVDVEKGSVQTIAGCPPEGPPPGREDAVCIDDLWTMAYSATENAIYWTQPEFHVLRRFDLASRAASTVFRDEDRIPRPAALAISDGKLYVADRGGAVYTLPLPLPPGPEAPVRLTPFADGKQVLAMCASGGRVYALQLKPNPAWLMLRGGPLAPPSPWGEEPPWPYLEFTIDEPVAFVPDPGESGSFFVASTAFQAVLGVKEYRFGELRDSNGIAASGLVDFEYPDAKPERTFRILLLGDSHMNIFDQSQLPEKRALPYPQRMASTPKQLELMLNTLAALDNTRLRYQVLTINRVSGEPLLVWPNYDAAAAVKRFDVDLVLLMLPQATSTVESFINRPITASGLPAKEIDAEYLLRPLEERLRGNPARAFVQHCQALGIADPSARSVGSWEKCGTAPGSSLHEELLALLAPPLRGIWDSLKGSRPDGKTPAFQVCYFATGFRGAGAVEREFWKELCDSQGIAWLDLLDPLTAVLDTWQPVTEQPGSAHWTPRGHMLLAFVLAHELIGRGVIPFRPQKAAPGS